MIKKKVTIAAEFIRPLVNNLIDNFDLSDDNQCESLSMYYDWKEDLTKHCWIDSSELLYGYNGAKLDTCQITNRLCDCFDVMITLKHFNEY